LWTTHSKATKYHKLPSELLDPCGHYDDLTRWQIDNVVNYFGTVVENALQETIEVGTKRIARYTLKQILEPDFRLHRDEGDSLALLKGATDFYDEVN
jgi:hypothetical protein